MIADENGKKKDIAEIDVELRDEMVLYIQKAILGNLEAIKQFLQIPGYEDICAGVYTYAVEEYGKILLLKNSSLSASDNNKVKFPYKTGFLNHYAKFPLAIKELPDTCKILSKGGFTDTGFTSSGFIHDLIADF